MHPKIPLEIIGTDAVLDLRAGMPMSRSDMRAECRLSLSRKRYLRDSFFPVCSPELLARGKRKIERAADLLHYPLIHFDWMNRDPQAPTWSQWLATARSIDRRSRIPTRLGT